MGSRPNDCRAADLPELAPPVPQGGNERLAANGVLKKKKGVLR